jgi:hypothetical protein
MRNKNKRACGEEASTNILHNNELVGSFASYYRLTRPSYYFTSPWPWYDRADEDTASSRRHQNPNIALRRAQRQSSPSIASKGQVDGPVIFRRTIRPRIALSPHLFLPTLLIIQGTISQRVVHGKKYILHSDDPIVNPRWEHNDGFADERHADS